MEQPSGVRTKNDEFRGIFVLRPLFSILQPLMVEEQKFKVLQKAKKEIYQMMDSNSTEFREFAENSRA